MQLSVLQSEARRLLGGISTADLSDANILLSLNRWIHYFEECAIRYSGSWEVQGEIATTNLVAAQSEYVFPGNLIALKKVEVNPTGATNGWTWAILRDLRNKTWPFSNNVGSVLGSSPEIDIFDNSIMFKDKPSTTVTAGLKIYYSLEQTELVQSYDEPTFPEFVHLGLVYGACYDFSLAKRVIEDQRTFKQLLVEHEEKIKLFYANRLPADRPRIRARAERYN